MTTSWFEEVRTGDEKLLLRQGDVFGPVNIPRLGVVDELPNGLFTESDFPFSEVEIPTDFVRGYWVVATPSCDLQQERTGSVLLLPVSDIESALPHQGKDREIAKELLRRGVQANKFLLPEGHRMPLCVADARSIASVPIAIAKRAARVADLHLRLLHPFRETFSAWIGRWIAAIGIEDEMQIPRFSRIHPSQMLRVIERSEEE